MTQFIIDKHNITGRHGEMALDVRYKNTEKFRSSFQKLPLVLFVHGFKGFKDFGAWNLMADEFAGNDFMFLKFNLSHNGTTNQNQMEFVDLDAFSKNTFSIEQDDIEDVLNWYETTDLIPSNNKSKEIYLLGHSRGGSMVIIKASEDARIKRVATLGAVADLNYFFNNQDMIAWKKTAVIYSENMRTGQQMPLSYGFYEDFNNNKLRFDVLNAAGKISRNNKKMLIVHGIDDPTISFQDAMKLKEANPAAVLELIPGADHVFGSTHPYNRSGMPSHLGHAVNRIIHFFS